MSARAAAPRSLAERAYELLVREITRLDLAPGEVLADKALTERFEIGRTPMREALQRLAREGLVVHQPNRGMFVSEISAASVQQIYEFRSLIDGHAARLAATRASASEMDDLTALHEALVDATERDDIDTYVLMDRCSTRCWRTLRRTSISRKSSPESSISTCASGSSSRRRPGVGTPSRAPTRK